MKALVIDDERLARKELSSLLDNYSFVELLGEAGNAEEALALIEAHQPDLLFLDVEMPGKTGFELLESLDRVPQVIFTTAHDQFATKAFEVNALDYLLKPIDPNRLDEALKKIKHDLPVAWEPKLGKEDQVFVKDGDKCWFVKLEKIRLFESDGNYIKVYFDSARPMIHKSLNALDERLDDRTFFRASRKHIINLGWVEKIDTWFNGGLLVELKGGEKIEVSRRQASRFKEKMSL